MHEQFKDHIGFTAAALDLLMHHMEQLQAKAHDDTDEDAIASCAKPVAHLHKVISGLHYKYFED